jgi:hypothetical protein
MSKLPSISGDFVRAVEAMRKAQDAYRGLGSRRQAFEVVRLERLVDSMIVGYNNRLVRIGGDPAQLLLADALEAYNVERDEPDK